MQAMSHDVSARQQNDLDHLYAQREALRAGPKTEEASQQIALITQKIIALADQMFIPVGQPELPVLPTPILQARTPSNISEEESSEFSDSVSNTGSEEPAPVVPGPNASDDIGDILLEGKIEIKEGVQDFDDDEVKQSNCWKWLVGGGLVAAVTVGVFYYLNMRSSSPLPLPTTTGIDTKALTDAANGISEASKEAANAAGNAAKAAEDAAKAALEAANAAKVAFGAANAANAAATTILDRANDATKMIAEAVAPVAAPVIKPIIKEVTPNWGEVCKDIFTQEGTAFLKKYGTSKVEYNQGSFNIEMYMRSLRERYSDSTIITFVDECRKYMKKGYDYGWLLEHNFIPLAMKWTGFRSDFPLELREIFTRENAKKFAKYGIDSLLNSESPVVRNYGNFLKATFSDDQLQNMWKDCYKFLKRNDVWWLFYHNFIPLPSEVR